MKKVIIVGSGKLATIIAKAISIGTVKNVKLAGIYSPTYKHAKALANATGVRTLRSIDEIEEIKPDYVVEAASAQAVKDATVTVLKNGADFLVLSTGAFEDDEFYKEAEQTAEKYDQRIYLVPGAIGGFDILGAAKLTGKMQACFIKNKLPKEDQNADFMSKTLPDYFRGSARELFRIGPHFLNVAISAGLAANGIDETEAAVVSGETVNFVTECKGDFGKATIYTEFGDKGYQFVGYSAVYLLQRLNSRIVI